MSDKQRCIRKLEDGKRCEREARPGGLFCERHRTTTEGTRNPISGRTGGGGGLEGWFDRKTGGPYYAPDK